MKTSKSAATPAKSKTASKSKSNTKSSTQSSSDVAQGLRQLFEDELKDIYWAEKALTKAIPKMIKKATSDELVSALEDHLEVTQGHVQRCEQAFEILGKPARAKKCEAMDGLTKEAEEIMSSTAEGVVRDAGIISAAQKVEHYEIASYGTLCAFARTLGENEVADLLEQTLNEEKEADATLTQVAESAINSEAANEGVEE
jgi:ferritin-like metal-binding protein YciE